MAARATDQRQTQFHTFLKAVIKAPIIVLYALGDSRCYSATPGKSARATDDAAMAYGYSQARVRLVPTVREIAQAKIVADPRSSV